MNEDKESGNVGGTVYKPSNPWNAKIIENQRITSENSPDDIRHIVIDISDSQMEVKEGQSIGVVVPGTDETGKKHRVRLYSVASRREGESAENTMALTIKRVLFKDDQTGNLVKGLASNYVCDLHPGDPITITGPVGRTFLLPKDPDTDIIMIAVGTGIAPFRAFIHHMFKGNVKWQGKVLLFFGTKSGLESLYMNDKNNDIGQYYTEETFHAFTALSRGNEKQYVQHKLRDNIELIWDIIKQDKFSVYICGLKGMEEGIEEVFKGIAAGQGLNWGELLAKYKEEKRWHIEVY
jgi:ferredoxin--NADP+ reductase